MMKIKKIQLVRPEYEISFDRPFIGRLYLALWLPRLIKVKRAKFNIEIASPIHKYAGTVRTYRVWIIGIPKIKVVKSE